MGCDRCGGRFGGVVKAGERRLKHSFHRERLASVVPGQTAIRGRTRTVSLYTDTTELVELYQFGVSHLGDIQQGWVFKPKKRELSGAQRK